MKGHIIHPLDRSATSLISVKTSNNTHKLANGSQLKGLNKYVRIVEREAVSKVRAQKVKLTLIELLYRVLKTKTYRIVCTQTYLAVQDCHEKMIVVTVD